MLVKEISELAGTEGLLGHCGSEKQFPAICEGVSYLQNSCFYPGGWFPDRSGRVGPLPALPVLPAAVGGGSGGELWASGGKAEGPSGLSAVGIQITLEAVEKGLP